MIHSSTLITFPGGACQDTSKILWCQKNPNNSNEIFIVTESTPFHPIDYNWPDQPSDVGTITCDEKIIPVNHCTIAALHCHTGEFLYDEAIKQAKIKRNDEQWYFVVVHVVDRHLLADNEQYLVGKQIALTVDQKRRLALSRSHTACHLASLALNQVCSSFWKKPPKLLDALGHPNFDNLAIVTSRIHEAYSCDQYRCGKSLRKEGFDAHSFFTKATFLRVEDDINKQLTHWISKGDGLKFSMQPPQAYLHEKREWCCTFSENNVAKIPCGGTHIASISKDEKITVTLEQTNECEFTMISKFVAR